MATESQMKANTRYRSQKVKQVNVSFYPKDKYLYEFICLQENKAGYIKTLIERDYHERVHQRQNN